MATSFFYTLFCQLFELDEIDVHISYAYFSVSKICNELTNLAATVFYDRSLSSSFFKFRHSNADDNFARA